MNNINIDFQVYDSNDPKYIIVLDTSIWMHLERKPAVIEIITPGEVKKVAYEYTKNGVNILNSINLGLNCNGCKQEFIDLPDGVYEITVKGSPDKFYKKRYYLKTTTIQSRLDDIILKYYSDCDTCDENAEEISRILRYQDLISVAEAFIRKGYKCEAQDIIFKIQKFINKHKDCRRCPHKV